MLEPPEPLRPETLPAPNAPPAAVTQPELTAWAPEHGQHGVFHSGVGGSIASRDAAGALADNTLAVHDWREEREDTLRSLARRPLDLWRPTGPPPPQEAAELAQMMMPSEPLSLRWLSEHKLDEWNETAFPTHPMKGERFGRNQPLAVPEKAVQSGPSDALLVFRAAFTDWLSEQTDKMGTLPGTSVKLITPDELHLLGQTARGYLGLETIAEPASGQRNITAVELCEHLRPARRAGEDPTTNARDLGGDASALREYLTGGTGAGEADLHRLMQLPPPAGSAAAKEAVGAAKASRTAALRASEAARVAMGETEEAEKQLRAAKQAAIDSEHRLAKGALEGMAFAETATFQEQPPPGAPPAWPEQQHPPGLQPGAAPAPMAAPDPSAASQMRGLSGGVAVSLVPGGRPGTSSIPITEATDAAGHSRLEQLGIAETAAPEPEEPKEPEEPEPESEPEPEPDYAWFTSSHPDLKVSNPILQKDQMDENGWSESRCGCVDCNPTQLDGAGQGWIPLESHGSVVTQKRGGGWRAAIASSRVMRGGLHYATFKLHRGTHVVLGVSRPEFAATTGDLPSGAGGGGWGFYAIGGQLAHNGQWGDWEGMRPAPPGAEVGLLLDYERATLTVFIDGHRKGILADGVCGPLCWMAELRNAGDSLELREMPPPENEACVDCAARGLARRACFGDRGTMECTLCGGCAVALDG